jgi:hypothetical protein
MAGGAAGSPPRRTTTLGCRVVRVMHHGRRDSSPPSKKRHGAAAVFTMCSPWETLAPMEECVAAVVCTVKPLRAKNSASSLCPAPSSRAVWLSGTRKVFAAYRAASEGCVRISAGARCSVLGARRPNGGAVTASWCPYQRITVSARGSSAT